MNWTGGSLQRSKNANKGITQKQKAHFARARSQLQNGATAGTPPPFRPGFFRGGQVSLCDQLPLFSSRTVRHTGHSRTLRSHNSRAGSSPVGHDVTGTRRSVERRPLQRHHQDDTATSKNTNGICSQKRKVADDDSEERLLEARRKSLLQQSDWAGLGRPKLPAINYSKTKENREEIGKRRKINNRQALTRHDAHSTRLVPRPLQAETSRPSGQGTSGALVNDHIKIRIGTDAFSNLTPLRQACTQSQAALTSFDASSDSILLENEDVHIVTPKPGQLARTEDQDPGRFVGAHTHVYRHGVRLRTRSESSRSHCAYQGVGSTSIGLGPNEDSSAVPKHRDQPNTVNPLSTVTVSPNQKDQVPECYITQQIEGTAHPFRLTFDIPSESSSVEALTNNACSGNMMIGEPNHGHDTANAALIEMGDIHLGAKVGGGEAKTPQTIDDGPWRAFLPVDADNSSHSIREDAYAFDQVHIRPRLPSPRTRTVSMSWSQQATQGARTGKASSPCVSASLPSIPLGSGRDELRKRPHMEVERLSEGRRTQRDENDNFWQKLVFGSDKDATTDLGPEIQTSRGEMLTKAERNIPSSLTLSSRCSTPFNPLAEPGFCVSDSAQDAATRAPLVTSPGSMVTMITSSTAAYSRAQDENRGTMLEPAADSDFGLQSIIHTSIQNNVSNDTDASPSNFSGDTAARALCIDPDRQEGCKNGRYGLVQTSRRDPASVYDIPESSDSGLTSVDAG